MVILIPSLSFCACVKGALLQLLFAGKCVVFSLVFQWNSSIWQGGRLFFIKGGAAKWGSDRPKLSGLPSTLVGDLDDEADVTSLVFMSGFIGT